MAAVRPAAPPAPEVVADQLLATRATNGSRLTRAEAADLVQATYDALSQAGWRLTRCPRHAGALLWDYDLPILAGLARGRSLGEIATDTLTPYATVKNRVEALKTRIGARSAAHAVAVAYRAGWMASLPPEPRTTVRLSPRQHAILTLLADGLSDQQIASQLGISTNTLRTHIRRLYTALGVSRSDAFGPCRPQAVAIGYQQRLLPLVGEQQTAA
ncbi:LuxR C-terminal-related transcriptional regulator [Streptomyces sp. NPDC057271]|uniref:helix-turn-helix transcriptional regulator n=1 Tax=unclassified Streptomyces TaxID=2593676 RepID=UPI00362FAE45